MGDLAVASLNRTLGGVNVLAWLVPILLAASGVAAFIFNDIRHGIFYIGFALYLPTYYAWLWYRKSCLTQHLESLRRAVRERALPTNSEASVGLPPRRLWASIPLFVVGGVAVGAIAFLSYRPAPGCRTADAAIELNFKGDLAAWTGATSDADLDRYRHWSDQLQADARQAADTAVAGPLHRIAELSTQAVSQLQTVHTAETTGASTDVITNDKTAYLNTITRILDEQQHLVTICHPEK